MNNVVATLQKGPGLRPNEIMGVCNKANSNHLLSAWEVVVRTMVWCFNALPNIDCDDHEIDRKH